MSTAKCICKALSAVLPGGALGASVVLALTSPISCEAKSYDTSKISPPMNVAERLRAIREGVSELSKPAPASGSAELETPDSGRIVPTWWGNGGWGRWHWGWGNGGWPNWHNWGNGWHNWGNGAWNNWNNGWHNYWHNW